MISEKQKNDDLDWFAKLKEFGPVSCPHCATNLGVEDDASHLRCPACNQDLVIGLATMDAGIRPWFVSSLFGLSLGFGFSAFMILMSRDSGPSFGELWPMYLIGVISFLGLIVVAKKNRRLERSTRAVRWFVACACMSTMPITVGFMVFLIYTKQI